MMKLSRTQKVRSYADEGGIVAGIRVSNVIGYMRGSRNMEHRCPRLALKANPGQKVSGSALSRPQAATASGFDHSLPFMKSSKGVWTMWFV